MWRVIESASSEQSMSNDNQSKQKSVDTRMDKNERYLEKGDNREKVRVTIIQISGEQPSPKVCAQQKRHDHVEKGGNGASHLIHESSTSK